MLRSLKGVAMRGRLNNGWAGVKIGTAGLLLSIFTPPDSIQLFSRKPPEWFLSQNHWDAPCLRKRIQQTRISMRVSLLRSCINNDHSRHLPSRKSSVLKKQKTQRWASGFGDHGDDDPVVIAEPNIDLMRADSLDSHHTLRSSVIELTRTRFCLCRCLHHIS